MKACAIGIEDAVSPHLEIGAFEALWANDVSSFKQIRDKLKNAGAQYPSELVETSIANDFFTKTMMKLKNVGIDNFGVRIEKTADYPSKLYDAEHPLVLLYFQGRWDLALARSIAIVGTRKPSKEGVARTKRLVNGLVKNGFTIFSGLATGIDTIVHETTIFCGGKTAAVIGTPITKFYPIENKKLQQEIAKNHLLISQVPIIRHEQHGPEFTRFFFPERNKTMSALTEATIIVEAGETSGTLTQAKAALKQGRKLFILNSNFENSEITWPQKFEQLGAIRVHTFDDILRGG